MPNNNNAKITVSVDSLLEKARLDLEKAEENQNTDEIRIIKMRIKFLERLSNMVHKRSK